MRIWLVLHAFAPECVGGTERTVEALARALQANGHDLTIVAGTLELGDPAQPRTSDWHGLRVIRVPRNDLYFDSWFKAYSPEVSLSFARLLQRERPEVVHVHHWIRLTTDLVRQARAAGCTTIVTLHDYFTTLARPARRVGEVVPLPPPTPDYVSAAERNEAFAFHRRDLRAEVLAAHARLTPSQAQADGLRALGLDPIEIQAIVAPPLLQRPQRLETRGHGRQLLTWATWYPDKGLHIVLEALRQAPGWSLDVFGQQHPPEYQAQIEQAAAGLDVRFHGAFGMADLTACAADCAVLPPLCHESHGLTLDEALCLGLPVVLSDVPSYRERAPQRSAAFFAAGNAAALAALLRSGQVQALLPPDEPQLLSVVQAAARHEALYRGAQRGDFAPSASPGSISAEERAVALFRRAERRLWTAVQQPDPPAPPGEFLGPAPPV